jgi:sugar lactone lactonase YvrE
MKRGLSFLVLGLCLSLVFSGVAEGKVKEISGFKTPESIIVGPDGRYYVSNIGEFSVDGEGSIFVIEDSKIQTLAAKLDDPKGLAFWQDTLYVADKGEVWQIRPEGDKEIFVQANDFPKSPLLLNDLAFDSQGNLYLSDTGTLEGADGTIFKIDRQARVTIFLSSEQSAEIHSPNGLIFDAQGNLLVIDFATGRLLKITPDSKELTIIGEGFGGGDGLAFDSKENLYISDYLGGQIFRMNPAGKVTLFAKGFQAPADITIDQEKNLLLVPDFKADSVLIITIPPTKREVLTFLIIVGVLILVAVVVLSRFKG